MAIERTCMCVCASMWRNPSSRASIWCGGSGGGDDSAVENTPCLGILWKIRIIFHPTPTEICVCVCLRINYTASILFPFVGLVFGKHSTFSLSLLLLFAIHLCIFLRIPHTSCSTVQCWYQAIEPTNRFVETHLSERMSNVEHCMITIFKTYYKCSSSLRRKVASAKKTMEMVTLVRFLSHLILEAKSVCMCVFDQFDGWPHHMEISPFKTSQHVLSGWGD